MGTTFGNGIWAPGTLDPIEWHVSAGITAVAASEAIGGLGDGTRQPILFRAADDTERAAIATLSPFPLVVGDQCYVASSRILYAWETDGWVIEHTFAAITWTPNWADTSAGYVTGVTLGNSTQSWSYTISGDRVTVSGWLQFAGTGIISGLAMPFPVPPAQNAVNVGVLGVAHWIEPTSSAVGNVCGRTLEGDPAVTVPQVRVNGPSGMVAFPFSYTPPSSSRLSVTFTYTRA